MFRFIAGLRRTPNIYFVYSERYQYSGSTVMRGQQLANIAKKSLPYPYHIQYEPTSHTFKNSVLFLTKGAIQTLSAQELETLKKRHNRLVFDPVDMLLPDHAKMFANVIVAASRSAFDEYVYAYPKTKIVIVDHHVDPRIKGIDLSKRPTKFRVGYFGELVNTVRSPAIEKRVDFIQVDTYRQENAWIKKLPDYTAHYAIRNTEQLDAHKSNSYKPFLKGFTAAHCNANILIQNTQIEAIKWLGIDYPYLLKGEGTKKSVLLALDQMEESYGSSDWLRGLASMREIKEKTSDRVIGEQLKNLFAELS